MGVVALGSLMLTAGLYLYVTGERDADVEASTSTACIPTMEHYDVQVRNVDTTTDPHFVEDWTFEYVGDEFYGYTGEGENKLETLRRGGFTYRRVGGGEWQAQRAPDLGFVGFCGPLPSGAQGQSESGEPSGAGYARGDLTYRLVGTEMLDGASTKRYTTVTQGSSPARSQQQSAQGNNSEPTPTPVPQMEFSEDLWVDSNGYIVQWTRAIAIPAGDTVLTSYVVAKQSGFGETNVLPSPGPTPTPSPTPTPTPTPVPADPTKPTGLRVTGADATSITLAWGEVAGARVYGCNIMQTSFGTTRQRQAARARPLRA